MASASQESTLQVGSSLSASLYGTPCTILLRGELGVGKTTFVKGLGFGLGLGDIIVSPTFALEQRYGKNSEEFLHLDLYRIGLAEARQMVAASEDFPGIRVIEWSEKLLDSARNLRLLDSARNLRLLDSRRPAGRRSLEEHTITVTLAESSPTTRTIAIAFDDLTLPDRETIETWRREVALPDHIARHCDAVGAFARALGAEFLRRGRVARPHALDVAGQLHDLLRFVDFLAVEDRTKHPAWKTWGGRYGSPHEEACARFLEERGCSGLAEIIRPHGLRTIDHPEHLLKTEQKLLFYADKRVLGNRIVSLDERFDEFVTRYGKGVESEKAKRWRMRTKVLERELFGEEIPPTPR